MELTWPPWVFWGLVAVLVVCVVASVFSHWADLRQARRHLPGNPHYPQPPLGEATRPPLLAGPSAALIVGPAEVPAVMIGPAGSSPVIGPSSAPALTVVPASPLSIEPPQRGAWDDRGWTQSSDNGWLVYDGRYHIPDRRRNEQRWFRGRVVVTNSRAEAYIADPPVEIKKHPKGPCFQLVEAPWFRVNWHHPAPTVDDAILYVEKVLDEAINR